MLAEKELEQHRNHLEQLVIERTIQLTKSENLLAETGRLARVGGWELDLKKNVLSFSEVTKQIHEVDPDYQPTLEVAINFYAPEAIPMISEAVRRAIEEGEPYNVELQLITAKQNRIWVRAIGQAYRENGKVVRIGGVFQDINERKLAEQEIARRAVQLEAAYKELEAFSYSVSHDLRAPLRHISGFVELLMSRFKENLPDKAQHYLNTISDSIAQMGMLIDDLLKFSRTGRMEINKIELDMQMVFDSVLAEVKLANPGREINWIIPALPKVYGDYLLLQTVWTNLIGNAVKFTRNREKVKIEVRVKENKDEYIFSVCDNGVGFDMQYAQKLFGVFQRLHPTAEFEGSGIGLANVRRIISRHGGKTWAEAKPDEGATFYFSLPKN